MFINDIQYWKELCPNLTVSEMEYWSTAPKVNAEDVNDRIVKDGYFHVPFDSWDLPLDEMAKCIEKLKELDIQPVWCFMYDEFWLLTTRIDAYIKSVLGEKYHKLPDMWAWHIDPAKEERGWNVHRDRHLGTLFDDGRPKSISVWIPLTDATVENGCMHVVPAARDPNYYTKSEEIYYSDWEEHFYENDKVAVEAKAGDLLVWNQQLLHWGGSSTNKDASPRISVSVEFVADYVTRLQNHKEQYPVKPWLNPFHVPTFDKKAELINTVVLRYQHMWEK
jgi:hypothetical protein